MLGAKIEEVSCRGNLITAKEGALWKYYWFKENNDFELLDTIECDKLFACDKHSCLYLKEQTLVWRQVGG